MFYITKIQAVIPQGCGIELEAFLAIRLPKTILEEEASALQTAHWAITFSESEQEDLGLRLSPEFQQQLERVKIKASCKKVTVRKFLKAALKEGWTLGKIILRLAECGLAVRRLDENFGEKWVLSKLLQESLEKFPDPEEDELLIEFV